MDRATSGFDVLMVVAAVVMALAFVTGLISVEVGAGAGLVLIGQGVYAFFHPGRPSPLREHTAIR